MKLTQFAPNILLLATVVMTACQNSMEEIPSSQLMVVERQQMEIGNSHLGKEQFYIDINISGPMILKD